LRIGLLYTSSISGSIPTSVLMPPPRTHRRHIDARVLLHDITHIQLGDIDVFTRPSSHSANLSLCRSKTTTTTTAAAAVAAGVAVIGVITMGERRSTTIVM
jgi:hypothetical protein